MTADSDRQPESGGGRDNTNSLLTQMNVQELGDYWSNFDFDFEHFNVEQTGQNHNAGQRDRELSTEEVFEPVISADKEAGFESITKRNDRSLMWGQRVWVYDQERNSYTAGVMVEGYVPRDERFEGKPCRIQLHGKGEAKVYPESNVFIDNKPHYVNWIRESEIQERNATKITKLTEIRKDSIVIVRNASDDIPFHLGRVVNVTKTHATVENYRKIQSNYGPADIYLP